MATGTKVTDPALLEQLNSGSKKITDPSLLDKLNGPDSSEPREEPITRYDRGGLPYESTHRPLTAQSALDAAMMIPAVGAEAGVLKGAGAIENTITRASPKIAQILGEGKVASTAATGAKVATAGGAGGATYSVGTGRNVGEGAALGAVGSTVLTGGGAAMSKGYTALKDYINRASPEAINNTAVQKILDKFKTDKAAGGISAQEVMELVDEARKTGKPMTVSDVAGTNVRKQAGTVARAPGESSAIAQNFLTKRDAEAANRLTKDVNKYLSNESGRQATEALAATRSAEGKPLFEEAYKGGSLAPLETQFTKVWQDTAEKSSALQKEAEKISPRVTMLKGKLSQTNDIYQSAALNKELKAVENELSKKQGELASAKMEEAEAHQVMQQAQKDGSINAPGAVWNPRIQRLLDLPEVKSGINEGIRLERLNAAADGRAFNATEYAIVGTDKAGNPIVGKVPNMRLLASAKEGLDSMLEGKGMRDENPPYRLTKLGVAVDKVRRSLLNELKTESPAYAKALESWAGHSQSMGAIRFGRNVFKGNPEEIAKDISEMSASEREFAKLGVADMVRERVLKTGFGGDEAKAIIKSDWAKMQLKPFFKNESEFNSFVKAVTDEKAMFQSKTDFVRGSQSAERLADDADNEMVGAGVKAAMGNWKGATKDALKSLIMVGRKNNWKEQKVNEAVAKLLFNPDITMDELMLPVEQGGGQGIIKRSLPYVGMLGAEQPLPANH